MGEVHNEWTSGTARRPPKPVVPDLGAPSPPPARRTSQLAPPSAPGATPGPSRTLWLALGLVVVVLSGRDGTSSTSTCDWKPGEADGSRTFIGHTGDITVYLEDGKRFIAQQKTPNDEFQHCTIALTPTTDAPAQPGEGS
jgi:hypothetical protein